MKLFQNKEEMENINMNTLDTFSQDMIKKIEDGVNLTENEIYELLREYESDVEYTEYDRKLRFVTSIVELIDFNGNKRLFSIDWQEDITGDGCDYYESQPVEVFRTKKEVFRIETCYEKKS